MNKIITIRDQVYNIIKLRIANGTYKHGTHLQELVLAEDLQVSRSPIREVLKQLVAEELLVATANKGVYVRSFTTKELNDIFDFRILMESAALNFLRQNPQALPEAILYKIRENILKLSKGDIDYAVSDETNPHYPLVQAMDNAYITRQHLRASYCTMSFHSVLFDIAYDESIADHLLIIDHILQKNFDKAEHVLRKHLLTSRDCICEHIHEQRP